MTPTRVEYGQPYSDGSGWARHVAFDVHEDSIRIQMSGSEMRMTAEEFWWLFRTAMLARVALGMDVIPPDGPQPPSAGEEHG